MIKPCLHCGNDTKKITEEFCCLGCLSAYKIINKLGFKDYYNLRKIDPEIRKIKPENEEKIDISEFAFDNGNNVFSITIIKLFGIFSLIVSIVFFVCKNLSFLLYAE